MGNYLEISTTLKNRLVTEQLHTHFEQLPAVIIAPALGAIFTAWVLWHAVNNQFLIIGLIAVLSISVFRIVVFKLYFLQDRRSTSQLRWHRIAVGTAFVSGCIWGCAAIFLYPPAASEYEVFMLVLLALIPVAPVAALAVYMPAFYAYYIPCILPFIITLGIQEGRAELMTAVLLLMMMAATLTFANKYSLILAEAIVLRLKLAEKKKDLEKAAVVKTRILASASHDLRQPVHALGLFVETLRNKISKPENTKLLKNIEEAALNLRIMLEGMLDISRLDAQVVEVKRCDFNLGVLLDSLFAEYQPQAINKGLRFHYVSTNLFVNTDPVLLERILRNLLSNAIKYTPKGGILLGCRRQQGQLVIQVCDTGIGIPENQIEKIFVEFTQLQQSQERSLKGLGLGLSIIKRLCHLLGHEIDVFSKPGKGSIFSIVVPTGVEAKDGKQCISLDTDAIDLQMNDFFVLVIDDDRTVREAMLSLLREWGGQVIAVTSAEEALQEINNLSKAPDICIIDYQLRFEKTAIDAITQLSPVLNEGTPIIIITGDTDSEKIKQAHNAGYLFLHKPVDPEQLKACLFELLDDSVV